MLRALHFGDLLCAVPAFRALRCAFPNHHITLIGLPWSRGFVARFRHYLDDFLEFPGYPGLPERRPRLRALPAFLAHAQSRRFDLALQMQGNGAVTNPLVLLLGARRTAGFYAAGQFCPSPADFLLYPEDEPEVRRPLRLLAHLGIPLQGEDLEFPVTHADVQQLAALPAARHLATGHYVCIHAGARSVERRWPIDRFARVADALARRGLQVVLTGTAAEAHVVEALQRAMAQPSLNLAGMTSLGSLAALLRSARLLVCNDTGVSHLAAALRVPSVVIFTASDVRQWAPLDRSLHRVLPRRDSLTNGHEVQRDDVLAEAERLLAETRDSVIESTRILAV